MPTASAAITSSMTVAERVPVVAEGRRRARARTRRRPSAARARARRAAGAAGEVTYFQSSGRVGVTARISATPSATRPSSVASGAIAAPVSRWPASARRPARPLLEQPAVGGEIALGVRGDRVPPQHVEVAELVEADRARRGAQLVADARLSSPCGGSSSIELFSARLSSTPSPSDAGGSVASRRSASASRGRTPACGRSPARPAPARRPARRRLLCRPRSPAPPTRRGLVVRSISSCATAASARALLRRRAAPRRARPARRRGLARLRARRLEVQAGHEPGRLDAVGGRGATRTGAWAIASSTKSSRHAASVATASSSVSSQFSARPWHARRSAWNDEPRSRYAARADLARSRRSRRTDRRRPRDGRARRGRPGATRGERVEAALVQPAALASEELMGDGLGDERVPEPQPVVTQFEEHASVDEAAQVREQLVLLEPGDRDEHLEARPAGRTRRAPR